MTQPILLELRDLIAVARVADVRNFKRAAADMNTTQPTLSRLIAQVEEVLGVTLFQRGWSGAELTSEGELVSQHARALLRLLTETEAQLFPAGPPHLSFAAGLSLSDLQVIDAIRRTGGATAAARDLDRSQPAISRVLTDFKLRFGLSLFDRRRSGLTALPEVEILSALYARLTALIEQIRHEVDQQKGLFSGRIAIGVLPFSGQNLIPRVFARLSELYPLVRLVFVPGTYFGLIDNLRRGEIDGLIGISRADGCPPDMIEIPLLTERFTITASTSHPVHQRVKSIADLEGETWLIPPHGSPVRAYFERLCQSAGITPRVQTCEIQFFTAVEQMLADGSAIGMQTYSATQLARLRPDLRVIDPGLTDNETTIALTMRRGGGEEAIFAEFLRHLRDLAPDFA